MSTNNVEKVVITTADPFDEPPRSAVRPRLSAPQMQMPMHRMPMMPGQLPPYMMPPYHRPQGYPPSWPPGSPMPYGNMPPGAYQPTIHHMGANAPPIHPCKLCKNEIRDDEKGIQCSAPSVGCNYFYHMHCSGLSPDAYERVCNEKYAEWICDSCFKEKPGISLVHQSG